MNENDIEERIRFLHYEEDISLKVLKENIFIKQPQYRELKKAFEISKYGKKGWEWHQLVRSVLASDDEIRQRYYIYQKLLNLILKHRGSYDDYFELKTENGTYHVPNSIADLNRLEILFQQYLEIYQKIINHIHFNILKNEHSGNMIRGKINWYKTVQKSKTEFPLVFITNLQEKEFVTPENILLILCSEWMYRESNRLLQIAFEEPLADYNRNLLNIILKKTEGILKRFPFQQILNISRKYWNLEFNDSRILALENESWLRFKNRLILNLVYKDLLTWIEKFRELNISSVSSLTPTRHILESIKNLDTVYEAWIFMEFVDYLSEKKILVNFQLNKTPHCQFLYKGKLVTFWYEKSFSKGKNNAWALEHRPDFTAMLENKILIVFDAKNYAKSNIPGDAPTDTVNKMLAYMMNLNANYGGLILPNHPGNWDDLNKSEKNEHFKSIIKNLKLEGTREKEIRERAKDLDLVNCKWINLLPEFKKIIKKEPVIMTKYENTRFNKKQILYVIRFSPETSDSSLAMKKSLDIIYEAITSRI